MTKIIGRNQNTNDVSSVNDGITAIDNNAITIVAANPNRTFLEISVRDENGWVREMPAATDAATRKGMFRIAGSTEKFPIDDIYTGEVSGINDKNNKFPTFYVTERS